MRLYNDLSLAVKGGWEHVLNFGRVQKQKNWQGVRAPRNMIESIDFNFRCPLPGSEEEAIELLNPNLPWAKDHFLERIGGVPLNPPPSSSHWPFANKDNEQFKKDKIFDHTYPERFWPKYAGEISPGIGLFSQEDFKRVNNKIINRGIRFEYGDLGDVINKLIDDPDTRQAYLPIWFPEDTGKASTVRVPCTLGYHFMIRDYRLDIKYIMRSTDMLRHFQDDLFMAYLLAEYVKVAVNRMGKELIEHLGYLTFLTFSAHVFEGEEYILRQKIKSHVRNNQNNRH